MNRLTIMAMSLMVVFLILTACAPKVAPATAPIKAAPAPAAAQAPSAPVALAKAAWEEEWERTIAAARKESKIVIYGSVTGVARQIIWGAFTQKYRIPVETIIGRTPEIIQKILSERRAGLYLVDVIVSGPTEIITTLRPAGVLESLDDVLLLPEVKDPEVWLDRKLPFIDPEHTIFKIDASRDGLIGINTNLVKPGEIKSARDLLNPKWKGKIILNDFTSGTGSTWMSVVGAHGLGWDYLRELAKQEPIIVENQRLMVDWLAQGKYAILIPPKPEPFNEVKAAGAPIEWAELEDVAYLTGGSGTIVQLKNAPHPNAARLLINWVGSKEGQIIWQQGFSKQSARVDIPTDYITPLTLRKPGVKYFNTDTLEFRLKKPEYIKIALEVFKSSTKQ